MIVGPRPWGVRLAITQALIPGVADQCARKFGLSVDVGSPASEAAASDEHQRDQNPEEFHGRPRILRVRSRSVYSNSPRHNSATPRASRNASAVPVAGAPKTLSICMPSGNSLGTGTVASDPLVLAMTCST